MNVWWTEKEAGLLLPTRLTGVRGSLSHTMSALKTTMNRHWLSHLRTPLSRSLHLHKLLFNPGSQCERTPVMNCATLSRVRRCARNPSFLYSVPCLCNAHSDWKAFHKRGLSHKLSKTGDCFSSLASHSACSNTAAKMRHQSLNHVLLSDRRQSFATAAGKESGDPLSPSSVQFRYYMDHMRKEHQAISKSLETGSHQVDSARQRLMELDAVINKWEELEATNQELAELQKLIQESSQDKEMKDMACVERDEALVRSSQLEEELLELLLPSEVTDDNDVIIEFSAGVGGQEAMLFASDLFEMYQRYAAYRSWGFNILEYFTTDLGGLRHASVSISGEQAYRYLCREGGVHRVQRVPKTEKSGRIHTSTMAIAVLPQPSEIDLNLDPKDLRIETKKASGAGGQHVNTTDSAVRITHIPTGIVAESQQERSQHKNRTIAMTMLQTRLYARILEERASSERSLRRSQIGSGARSEKIRTYNFPQDRVTDHRIGRTVHGVDEYLNGAEILDEMVCSVVEDDERDILRGQILEVFEKEESS